MTFKLGASVNIVIEIAEESTGIATDPASVNIRIDLPDGSMAQEAVMQTDITGTFHHYYDIPAEPTGQIGVYSFRIIATDDNDRRAIYTSSFEAEASI